MTYCIASVFANNGLLVDPLHKLVTGTSEFAMFDELWTSAGSMSDGSGG